ncbi:MAG: DUF4212 domain-containing protein [Burkholderiales bacterium]|nr:DUF4212 domain-containing protein [Burkholderiales bacterium]MDE2276303.1 DUF4212 domain-containing protein [Burkholderiales bacterium]
MAQDPARRRFWSRTRRLTGALLLAWLAANLALAWFARDLDAIRVFGLPGAYALAAVGLLLMYLAIIVVYAVAMDRLEAGCLRAQAQAPAPAPGAGDAPVRADLR